MTKRGLLFLLIILYPVLTVLAAPPELQGSQRIDVGETATGTINDEQFRQLFVFSGQQNQVISITMQRESGDLDPYLILTGPQGNVLATSDDDAEGRNAAITSQNLPENGDYLIIATRFAHEHGVTTGNFSLTLTGLGNTPSSGAGEIEYGESIIGQINDEAPWYIYTLEAERGQVINVQLKRTSGDLDPLLDLFNSELNLLMSGDDDPSTPGSLNAGIINFMIPEDGVYYIRATRYNYEDGTTSGTFILTIAETPTDELGTRPLTARYIDYGDSLEVSIDEDVFARFFRFEATRGDVISVIATRLSGNIVPRISLLNAEDLRPISVSETGPGQEETDLLGLSLPETGSYLLVVSRYQGAEGTSTGEVSFTITGRSGAPGDDRLELIYGARVNGVINDEKYRELYRFTGEAGDIIDITMRRIEGDLDALLTLFDETGKQLTSDDDGFDDGSKDARIQRFRLPEDGVYTIESSRYQRFAGETSGIYQITLQKTN